MKKSQCNRPGTSTNLLSSIYYVPALSSLPPNPFSLLAVEPHSKM